MTTPQADEIDVVGILLFLRRNIRLMAAIFLLSIAAGIAYILLTPPEFQSQTVFMLKKGDEGKDNSNLLSRLGGMGSNMAALGIGVSGSSLQDRAEFILKSRELAETVINTRQLLPRLFPERWDAKAGRWQKGATEPTIKDAVLLLRGAVSVSVKKGFFTLAVAVKREPELARDLVDAYLEALNAKIQLDAKNESTENRTYLEQAMRNTLDPTVQEKIQNRIAYEIEKYMLVSSNSLDILERPVVPDMRSRPKAKMILILATLSGMLAALAIVVMKEFAANLRRNYLRRAGA